MKQLRHIAIAIPCLPAAMFFGLLTHIGYGETGFTLISAAFAAVMALLAVGSVEGMRRLLLRGGIRLAALFWVGLTVFIFGPGPLLTILMLAGLGLTKDPNPNPVALGMLALTTFWPSVGLILGGVLATGVTYLRNWRRAKAALAIS
jgi:hypothetical protein